MKPHLTAPLLLAAALPLASCGSLTRMAATPTHLVSHQLCSAAFVAGVEPERFYREAIAHDVKPVSALLSHHVDNTRKEVTASFAGLVHSRAVYRGEAGCLVQQGDLPRAPSDPTPRPTPRLDPIAGPEVVAPTSPALAAALDRAFVEFPDGPRRYTKAVVIVHDGRVIAERYAAGYGPRTRMTGWSMTKSVTSALVGVLVRQGRLKLTEPAPVAAWADPKDPRHAITVDNLLRMSSGLDVGQSLTVSFRDAFDPSSQMLFATPDMAKAVEGARLKAPPGTQFTYANANTLLLSRIVRDEAGGTGDAALRFARTELFDKLGMSTAVFEQDASGTPIGASHLWASPRDWARFAMLYLDDGVVGGERILPPGWVAYSASPTPGSEAYGYGAGWWTNRGGTPGARRRPHMPPDSFMARGSHGQYAIVVPSAKLVVVRMGDAYTPYDDIEGVDRLVGDVLAAIDS